jgi:RNA polymerase sigma-70 factor (ECF subfamily)
VAQLRRRDTGAAEALARAYGDRVYRLAIRITGNASDAEEVVQDALWTVTRKIDTFRGAAAFGSWLYRITANTAYQKLRGRRSTRDEVSWEHLAPSFDDQGRHVEAAIDRSRRVEDPAIGSELRSVLSAAIDELPADYRLAFLMHDVEGLSNPEIAETLHINLGTIKSRVHRTRLFLRKHLAHYVGDTSAHPERVGEPALALDVA